jgi:hypothetical protein
MTLAFYRYRSQIVHVLLLILVTAIFRLPIFLLSHNNNDELIHLSLAKKIENYGIKVFEKKEYNLFYIERGLDSDNQLIVIFDGERKMGSLLEGFLGEREELSHHPPALPFFIAISHIIFSKSAVYLASISNNLYFILRNVPVQFYACVVQFLVSLLLVLSTYFLGGLFFSHRIGLISAIFLSLTPIELLTANKIWADDMTAFFSVLAVILHLYGLKSDKSLFSLFAGVSCGIAILAKMSAVYIVFSVLLFHLRENNNKDANLKNIQDFFFDKKILYFLSGVFIMTAWWFNLYYSNFNISTAKSFFTVNEKWEPAKSWNVYFSVVSNRPWYSYFILIPFQFPLYSLSYIFILVFWLRKKFHYFTNKIGKEGRYLQFLIIWIITVFIFLALKPGKELRYMLIAYPAIAVISAYCLDLLYEFLRNKNLGLSLNSLKFIFISVVVISMVYSLKIALPRIIFRADIIPIPL